MTTAVWYAIRATGVVSLILLTVTTVLGLLSASRVRTHRWPAFAQVDLHKRATMLALVFLGFHVMTAVIDTYVHVGLLSVIVPFTSSFRTFWTGLGTIAVDLLLAVAISSALRSHIAPRVWRGLHWVAYACWPFALAHALGAGTDATRLWMDATAAVCTIAVVTALTWRIGDRRTAREEEDRVGATTRAVPLRHRAAARTGRPAAAKAQPSASTVRPASAATRVASAAAPTARVVATATRFLEKNRR